MNDKRASDGLSSTRHSPSPARLWRFRPEEIDNHRRPRNVLDNALQRGEGVGGADPGGVDDLNFLQAGVRFELIKRALIAPVIIELRQNQFARFQYDHSLQIQNPRILHVLFPPTLVSNWPALSFSP